jgi:hypothetical protein
MLTDRSGQYSNLRYPQLPDPSDNARLLSWVEGWLKQKKGWGDSNFYWVLGPYDFECTLSPEEVKNVEIGES